jgi:hypothetical protein
MNRIGIAGQEAALLQSLREDVDSDGLPMRHEGNVS